MKMVVQYSVITLTERISFLSRAKMRDFAAKVKNDKVILDLKENYPCRW